MLKQPMIEKLLAMRLHGMGESLNAQEQDPAARELSFLERCLGLLADQQWNSRENQALQPASVLTASQRDTLAALGSCAAVVAQSIGDTPVMESILDLCNERSIPMVSAITPSSPSDFIRDRVLPMSDILFCSNDELRTSAGFL